jgi:hypothetical protein
MVFGIILILMMIFRPQGIIPSRRRRMELEGVRRRGGETPDAAAGVGAP